MTATILAPLPAEPRDAVVADDLLMEVVDLLTGYAALGDEFQLCVMPGCMVCSTSRTFSSTV